MASETKPPGATGSPVAPAVAAKPTPGATGNVAPGSSALESVPRFGGNRGGKARKDGLAPGSPAAKEADRKADAERKRKEREARAALAQPAPLPSAVPAGPGQPATPLGPQNPGDVAPGAEAPPIPWSPDMLREFTDEIVNAVEESRVSKFVTVAREGKIPERVVKEIAQDCRYAPGSKRTLQIATPRVAAKYLNKTGISAEFADEVALVAALGSIFVQGRKLQNKLEELIQVTRQNAQPLAARPAPQPQAQPQSPTVLPDPPRPPGAPPNVTATKP